MECRRKFIYKHFPGNFQPSVFGCQCCDICARSCDCGDALCPQQSLEDIDTGCESSVAVPRSVRTVNEQEKQNLRTELSTYMKDLLIFNTSGSVASLNLIHEFTTFHIKQVLDNCHKIKTLRHVVEFAEIWRKSMAEQSLSLLTKYLMTLKVKNFKFQKVLQRSQMKCLPNGTILEMPQSYSPYYMKVNLRMLMFLWWKLINLVIRRYGAYTSASWLRN